MQVGEGQKGMRQREQAKREQAVGGRHMCMETSGLASFPAAVHQQLSPLARFLARSRRARVMNLLFLMVVTTDGRVDGRGRCTTTAATNAGTNKRRGKQGRGFRKAEGGDSNLEIGKWRRRCVAIQSMEIYLRQISPCSGKGRVS